MLTVAATDDPVVFLLAVMNSEGIDLRIRLDAAKTLFSKAPPVIGVKDHRQDAARKAGAGRFGAGKAPVRLVT